MQVNLADSIYLYNLDLEKPKLVSFVSNTPFYMIPANFVDIGVKQIQAIGKDNQWNYLNLNTDRSALINANLIDISGKVRIKYNGIIRTYSPMNLYGLK